MIIPKKSRPLTRAQVQRIQPQPREFDLSIARFKDGRPDGMARPHAIKRAWSFDGSHKGKDGKKRPGKYVDRLKSERPL